jgi:hypothetical protein
MQLVKLYDRVSAHDWSSYLLNDHLAVDFDQIFTNIRAESRLLEGLAIEPATIFAAMVIDRVPAQPILDATA